MHWIVKVWYTRGGQSFCSHIVGAAGPGTLAYGLDEPYEKHKPFFLVFTVWNSCAGKFNSELCLHKNPTQNVAYFSPTHLSRQRFLYMGYICSCMFVNLTKDSICIEYTKVAVQTYINLCAHVCMWNQFPQSLTNCAAFRAANASATLSLVENPKLWQLWKM